jgi:hypothetical protein
MLLSVACTKSRYTAKIYENESKTGTLKKVKNYTR